MLNQKSFSIEVFPPKEPEAVTELRKTRKLLAELNPKFFSITYGAGGSTQQGTQQIALEIKNEGFEASPHITCAGTSKEIVRQRLQEYKDMGIKNLVALRGDIPNTYGGELGEFRYANELIDFIRQQTGDWFKLAVAAYPEMHPQAKSINEDIANFVRKVKAGADLAITQYFYNAEAYFKFVEATQAAGIDIPIIAGVMPITNYKQLVRFSDMCCTEIPRWIRLRLESYENDLPSLRAFGLDVVTSLCEKLLEGGAPGLHFFSLNRANATREIYHRLTK